MRIKKVIFISAIIIFFFTGCKKEDYISFQELSVSMHYDEQKQLALIFSSEELRSLDYNYQSSDENIASVSDSGLVSGVSIGTVVITATSSDGKFKTSCTVVIEPKSKLYREPYMGWGETKATIKANETRILISESAIRIKYKGEHDYMYGVFYDFSEEDTLSIYNFVQMGVPSIVTDNIMTFCKERYRYIDSSYVFVSGQDNTLCYTFQHRTKNIYCHLYFFEYNYGVVVLYYALPNEKWSKKMKLDKLAIYK